MDSWPSPSSPLERKGDEEGLEEAEEGEEEAEDEEDTERAERSYCGGEWVVLRLKEKKAKFENDEDRLAQLWLEKNQ